jgi:hypothetical protein
MKKTCLLAVAALGLVACGPGEKIGNGKQGAAEALFAASGPTKGAADNNKAPIDVMLQDLTLSCKYGGSATLKNYTGSFDTGKVQQKFTLSYANCGAASNAVYAGAFYVTPNVTTTVSTTAATAMVSQTFKGKVTVGGDFNDFLDADITEDIDASALASAGSAGAQVTVKLVGKLSDSSGSYDYNENVTLTAGNLSVQTPKH